MVLSRSCSAGRFLRSLRFSAPALVVLALTAVSFAAAAPEEAPRTGGLIRGVVRFPGETPPPSLIAPEGEPGCPHSIAENHLLVRQENRGIKNVLVILENPPVRMVPWKPVDLTVSDCTLTPRLQWIPIGTAVWLKNPGAADHRLRMWREHTTLFEVDLAAGSPPVRRALVRPGLYRVDCERHLWERAWVYVSEHPYVTLTQELGRFEIRNVPPGSYALRVWHEGWEDSKNDRDGRRQFQPMEQALPIRVSRSEPTEVLFEALRPAF